MLQPQTARDKVLWVLTFSDEPLDRNSLHTRARLKISELKDILNSLAREGRIRQSREDPPMVSIRQSREQLSCAAKKRERSKKISKRVSSQLGTLPSAPSEGLSLEAYL